MSVSTDPPSTPHIEGYTDGELIDKGQFVNLRCVSKAGNPPAQLTWFKNDLPIQTEYRYVHCTNVYSIWNHGVDDSDEDARQFYQLRLIIKRRARLNNYHVCAWNETGVRFSSGVINFLRLNHTQTTEVNSTSSLFQRTPLTAINYTLLIRIPCIHSHSHAQTFNSVWIVIDPEFSNVTAANWNVFPWISVGLLFCPKSG